MHVAWEQTDDQVGPAVAQMVDHLHNHPFFRAMDRTQNDEGVTVRQVSGPEGGPGVRIRRCRQGDPVEFHVRHTLNRPGAEELLQTIGIRAADRQDAVRREVPPQGRP